MSYKIMRIEGPRMYVRIFDKLRPEDMAALQAQGKALIDQGMKIRVLAVVDHFQGFEHSAEWGDIGFMLEYGDEMEKMAIVGDERWKDEAFMFAGKGLRSTEIEFFPHSALHEAEQWLEA